MQHGASAQGQEAALKAQLELLKSELYKEFRTYRSYRQSGGWLDKVEKFEAYVKGTPIIGSEYAGKKLIETPEELRQAIREFAGSLYQFYNHLFGGSTLKSNLETFCDDDAKWQPPALASAAAPEKSLPPASVGAGAAADNSDTPPSLAPETAQNSLKIGNESGDDVGQTADEIAKLELQDADTKATPPSTAEKQQRQLDAQQAQLDELQKRLDALPRTPLNSPVPSQSPAHNLLLGAGVAGMFWHQQQRTKYMSTRGLDGPQPPTDSAAGQSPSDSRKAPPPRPGGKKPMDELD